MSPENLKFAKTHEWAAVEGGPSGGKIATIGISAFAVEALTDLVYIQLPQVGRQLKAGESFGEIESVKAVSDLYSPVDGEIVEVNSALANKLEILNTDPYGAGWMLKVRLKDEGALGQLLDYAGYKKVCEEEAH